jgi:hypothetical protein
MRSTVGGGEQNTAGGIGRTGATVGGGTHNTASGDNAAIPGGFDNDATGAQSFAAGKHAKALANGTFVWADSSSDSNFTSVVPNQFLIRAAGGVEIFGTPPDPATPLLDVNGTARAFKLCIDTDCRTAWPSGGGITQIAAGTGITLSPGTITTTGSVAVDAAFVPLLANANNFTQPQSVSVNTGTVISTAVTATNASTGGGAGVKGFASATSGQSFGGQFVSNSATGTAFRVKARQAFPASV